MKRNTSRRGLFISLALVFLTFLSGIIINLLTGNKDFNNWLEANELGIKKLSVGAIAVGIALLLLTYLHIKNSQLAEPITENIEPNVKSFFDSLKDRYQYRYQSKLDGRFEISLEVSKSFDSQNPQKFIERYAKDAKVSEAFTAINNAFEKKGRLLIVGNPGVGKTVLLLKFALNLLGKIDLAKQEEAFPVIFNLASWSSYKYENFEDWLFAALVSGNGLSKNFAATLLHQKRIIFLLDGLDELARNATEEDAHRERAKCLASLNKYLRQGRKAVICCRREEFIQMKKETGQDAPVSAKIEVLDLTKAEVYSALQRAQKDEVNRPAADKLREIIKINKSFLEVLRTPFYFTTALEVFDNEILKDDQIPDQTDDLKKYLLDKFVDTKLNDENTPNPNNFKPEKTKKWLTALSMELKLTQLIDFELSVLQPHSLRRPWLYELLHGLVTALGILLCFGWIYGLLFGLYVVFKLIDVSYLGSGNYSYIQTEDIQHVNVDKLPSRRKLKRGLIYGLVSGLVAGLLFNLPGVSVGNLAAASVLGLFIGIREIVREVSYFVKVDTPYQRLEAGFIEKGWLWVLVCLAINVLSLQINNESVWDNKLLLFFSLIGGAMIGFSSTPLFRHFILRLCLYLEGTVPLKYATFLDYVAEARILEKDGGQWRFRHQNLQAYFTDMKGVRFMRIIEPL